MENLCKLQIISKFDKLIHIEKMQQKVDLKYVSGYSFNDQIAFLNTYVLETTLTLNGP